MWRALQQNPALSDSYVDDREDASLDRSGERAVEWHSPPPPVRPRGSLLYLGAVPPTPAPRKPLRVLQASPVFPATPFTPIHYVVNNPAVSAPTLGFQTSPFAADTTEWSAASLQVLNGSIQPSLGSSSSGKTVPSFHSSQVDAVESIESAEEEDEEDEEEVALNKRPWSRSDVIWDLVTERCDLGAFQKAFSDLAEKHHGGSWIPRSTYTIKKKGPRQFASISRYNCTFSNTSGCPFIMRTVAYEDGTWEIEVGNVDHNDHSIDNTRRGLPKKLRIALAQSTFEKTPRELKMVAAREHQQVLTSSFCEKLTAFQKRERLRGDGVNLPAGMRNTYGGLNTLMDFVPREELLKTETFTTNTPWLLSPAQVDAERMRIVAVYSTDNLLLNGFRSEASGLPSVVSLDCTYRLTSEGPGCMVVGTVSADQRWHTISYSLVNKEDCEAHAYVLASTKAALERVVAERIRAGERI
jgi:hypothetical protein